MPLEILLWHWGLCWGPLVFFQFSTSIFPALVAGSILQSCDCGPNVSSIGERASAEALTALSARIFPHNTASLKTSTSSEAGHYRRSVNSPTQRLTGRGGTQSSHRSSSCYGKRRGLARGAFKDLCDHVPSLTSDLWMTWMNYLCVSFRGRWLRPQNGTR